MVSRTTCVCVCVYLHVSRRYENDITPRVHRSIRNNRLLSSHIHINPSNLFAKCTLTRTGFRTMRNPQPTWSDVRFISKMRWLVVYVYCVSCVRTREKHIFVHILTIFDSLSVFTIYIRVHVLLNVRRYTEKK